MDCKTNFTKGRPILSTFCEKTRSSMRTRRGDDGAVEDEGLNRKVSGWPLRNRGRGTGTDSSTVYGPLSVGIPVVTVLSHHLGPKGKEGSVTGVRLLSPRSRSPEPSSRSVPTTSRLTLLPLCETPTPAPEVFLPSFTLFSGSFPSSSFLRYGFYGWLLSESYGTHSLLDQRVDTVLVRDTLKRDGVDTTV